MLVGHAGVVELALEVLPALGLDRDREVVQPAEHLGVGPEVEAGEVEEREQVAVADVEEEVGRALVVAVLEQLGERELEQVLVEADRPLDVGAEQRDVVRRRGPTTAAALARLQVCVADALAFGLDRRQVDVASPRRSGRTG